MSKPAGDAHATDVPLQVFEAFLGDLEKVGLPPEVTQGLRKALVEDGNISDRVLRSAVLFEDTNL